MPQKTKKQSKNLQTRPPVVVVLGHVDHGKSSILEAIKDLKITTKEAGGITQHIGAYEIEHQAKKITFIDTPGHEAFSAMRSRGAKVADIAILVIAGDEGVKPQTKEAISHIKEAQIPMIVAINKTDKPGADSEKIKRELSTNDVLVESMGGKVPSVDVSAKTGQGITDLLELILLVTEVEELKEDISKPAQGVIIESHLDALRGPTTTLILQNGILKTGDILGTVSAVGKVKTLEDFQGEPVQQAVPSMPVIVLSFEKVPGVGEKVNVYPDIETAKQNLGASEAIVSEAPLAATPDNKSETSPSSSERDSDKKFLNLILKVDVLGSIEAIKEVLKNLPQEQVALKILKAEVGEITESDVKLARSANAKIIGFRVKVNPIAQKLALRDKITIINFDVIYELAEAVKNLLEKMLKPEIVRTDLGEVKVLIVFRTEKNRQIVGGKVIEGRMKKGASLEIYREEEMVGKGRAVGLQQDKKETDEVGKRSECGVLFEGDVKIEEGDILRAHIEEKRKIEL